MTVRSMLQKARGLVAGGWTPGLSKDSSGSICWHGYEGLARICLLDALLLAAQHDDEMWEVDRLLVWAAGTEDLTNWEMAPGRRVEEVVAVFTRALQRALKLGLR